MTVAGDRQLYLECRGQGRPTVLLEAGLGNAADLWDSPVLQASNPKADPRGAVLPAVARFARVCAYDRPGTARLDLQTGGFRPGRSDPVAMPRTAGDIARDLRALVRHAPRAAGLRGPRAHRAVHPRCSAMRDRWPARAYLVSPLTRPGPREHMTRRALTVVTLAATGAGLLGGGSAQAAVQLDLRNATNDPMSVSVWRGDRWRPLRSVAPGGGLSGVMSRSNMVTLWLSGCGQVTVADASEPWIWAGVYRGRDATRGNFSEGTAKTLGIRGLRVSVGRQDDRGIVGQMAATVRSCGNGDPRRPAPPAWPPRS